MKKLLALLILIALLTAVVLMFKYLPWYVSVCISLLLIAGTVMLVKVLLKRLLMAPFKLKGAALKGAGAEVVQVIPAEKPTKPAPEEGSESEGAGETEEDPVHRNWYYLDVQITPLSNDQTKTPFTHWEVDELALVRPGTQITDKNGGDPEVCVVHSAEVYDGEIFHTDFDKVNGPQYIRLLIGVLPDVRELEFQYYLESFGHVSVPE